MNRVATVITYCTHDYRFIGKCIEEAKKFSDQIIIPVCDHFYDGSPENRFLLERTYAGHTDCQFIEFSYDPNRLYTPYLSYINTDSEWPRLWHATARYIGFLHLNPQIEYVLFLDCDEIVEGDRFAKWLKTQEYKKFNAMRLSCYYYVLRCNWRAKSLQELPLFAKRSAFASFHFIHPDERHALFQSISDPKGHIKEPFIHHYSWVRPLNENLHKAKTWGHQKDRDWNAIVQSSFAGKKIQEFFGVDFEFEEITNPYFDPLAVAIPSIKKVDHRSIMLKELAEVLGQ